MANGNPLRLLLVEDNPDDALLIERTLKKHSNGDKLELESAETLRDVIALLNTKPWDLVICDYVLPGFDATAVIQLLEELELDIPFILISGSVTRQVAADAIAMGADQYLEKENIALLMPVIRRELKIKSAYEETLKAFIQALSFRDNETSGHSERVVDLTVRLARKMGLAESHIVHMRRGALLHDIGKLGVSDMILLKPTSLTAEEMELMKMHPLIGHDLLSKIPFLKRSVTIPYYHHERWDGSGYPFGLKGNQIPMAARIFAVVDVWDAMTTNRPYREAMTYEDVLLYMVKSAGKLFDPAVVEAFVQLQKE